MPDVQDHRDFEELLELYALDALDTSDRVRFETHLASGCPKCQASLAESRRGVDALLMSIEPVPPPPRTKDALMARVRRDERETPPQVVGTGFVWPFVAAACLLMALGLGFYTRSLRDALGREAEARRAAEGEAARLRDSLSVFTSPSNRAVTLSGQPAAADARATAFLDSENGRLFLYVENLPPLGPDRTYQVWLLVDGAPVSVGTFDVGTDGDARLDGQPLPEFEGTVSVAVTEEPAGGVPQPTGPMVLLGS